VIFLVAAFAVAVAAVAAVLLLLLLLLLLLPLLPLLLLLSLPLLLMPSSSRRRGSLLFCFCPALLASVLACFFLKGTERSSPARG